MAPARIFRVVKELSFAEGDLVRLRQGGPLMAIKFATDELLLCVWVDASGRTQRATFAPDQLVPDGHVWVRALARLTTRWPVVALC